MNLFKRAIIIFSGLIGSLASANSSNKCNILFSDAVIASAPQRVEIVASADISLRQVSHVRSMVEETLDFYEKEFPKMEEAIQIRLGSDAEALRTGYDFKENVLNFPELQGVEDLGINSADVIHHELFHLLTCRNFPSACSQNMISDPATLRLHEAFADYFAYKMNPNAYFGEDYFINKPFLREYSNDLTVSLTDGAHGQANALTKYLIKNNISLQQIADLLSANKFSLEALSELSSPLRADIERDLSFSLNEEISAYPLSSSRRYRIKNGIPFIIKFKPNSSLQTAKPQIKIAWAGENGKLLENFEFKNGKDELAFEVIPKAGARPEKAIAIIYSEGHVIGFRAFYFGVNFKDGGSN